MLTTQWGTTWHGTPRARHDRAGEPAVALFTPAAVAVYRDKPHGSPRNTVEVTVAELDGRGPAISVRADEQPDGAPGLAADITAEAVADLRLAPGDRVYFSVKAQEVTVHLEPVTQWFDDAIKGLNRPNATGASGHRSTRATRGDLAMPAIAYSGYSQRLFC